MSASVRYFIANEENQLGRLAAAFGDHRRLIAGPNHNGHHALAEVRMRHADHGAFGDAGQFVQQAFDREGGDRRARSAIRRDLRTIADHVITDEPYLYVYVSHGQNTYDPGHHRRIAVGFSLSREAVQGQEALLREGLAAFDFGPGEVRVEASNGLAFRLG